MENIFNHIDKQDTNNKIVELAFPKFEQEEDDDEIQKGPSEGLVRHLKFVAVSFQLLVIWLLKP